LDHASSILLEEAIFLYIADVAPENPVFYFTLFPLVPLDLGLVFLFGLIINILR